MIKDFLKLKDYLKGKAPLRLVIVAANDDAVLSAAMEAVRAGWVKLILIGSEKAVDQKEFSEVQVRFIMEADLQKAAELGADLLFRHEADLIMKGGIMTADFIKPILAKERELIEPGKLLSHVAAFNLPGRGRLTFMSDGAINITPDLGAKEQIIENAVRLAELLGYIPPKVALLSAIEKVNPKISSSVEAAELQKKGENGRFGNILISGPLALDNALCESAVIRKGLEADPVAGVADVLIVPELVSGNILYKAFSLITGFPTGGVVVGAKVPIILTSRADLPETKVNSITLACFLKHKSQ